MNKTRNALLLVLLATIISLLLPNEFALGQTSTYEIRAPVGIYEVQVSAPENVEVRKTFDVNVSVTVTGINESSIWYNNTYFEGVESVKVSIVEAGITREKRIDTTMITNTNVSMVQPSLPVYVVNVTSIEHSFTFNSSFLDVGVYSLYVLVKGFRWAVVGLAFGYSDFYIEEEKLMSITETTTPEGQVNDLLTAVQQLNLTIGDLRQQITTMTRLLYATIGVAVVGVVIGAVGVFLARKRL